MNRRDGVAAAIAFVAGLVLVLPAAWFSPRSQVAVSAGAAVSALAVATSAGDRYRAGRDPHALFLATGWAVVAVQALVFGVWWPIHHGSEAAMTALLGGPSGTVMVAFSGLAPVYAFQFGWLVAGCCFVLGTPWWDRRGRGPIRWWLVVVIVTGVVALVDRYLAASYRGIPAPGVVASSVAFRERAHVETLGWILGVAAATGLGIAAFREVVARRDPPHGLLGVAFAAAVAVPLSAIRSPTQGLAYVQWADAMQIVAPAIAFVALVSAGRAETSRMRRASDRAEEVLGGRAEIASVIAHDIRSPVSSIKSIAASTIANYERLDDAQRLEFVEMIDREAQQVLDVVHQMSVALKVDARTLDLVRRPTPLAAVVREAVGEAATRGHDVEVDVAPGVTADVDGRWLAEAIRQGIDNAAVFSPEGASIRVAAAPGAADGSAVITVADEGPGIPSERRESVFERFASWPPAGNEDVPGSGLGLFICRGIVREHGGEVTLEDGEGRGTILRISLPWGTE